MALCGPLLLFMRLVAAVFSLKVCCLDLRCKSSFPRWSAVELLLILG